MARGRLVSRSLGSSRKFHSLLGIAGNLGEFCQVLFPLIVANTDDFGRMSGDAFTIKHQVLPTSPRSESEFDEALNALHRSGIICRYMRDGERYLQVTDFAAHQVNLHKRTKSQYPDPTAVGPSADVPEVTSPSRKLPEIPAQENLTELNRRELNSSELNSTEPRFARARENGSGKNFGRVHLHRWQIDALIDRLGDLVETFDLDVWLDGLNGRLSGKALPRDTWKWVQDEFQAEITRRSLPTATTATGVDLELVKSLIERDGRP